MIFWINKGKGSFTVRADSGIELEFDDPSRCQDTKILLQPFKDNVNVCLRNVQKKDLKARDMRTQRETDSSYFPSPMEVAEDDQVIQQVKTTSLKEAQYMNSCAAKENYEIKRALKLSELEQNEMRSEKEEKLLEHVLALSAAETNAESEELHELSEKDKIQIAIQRSLDCTEYVDPSSKLEEDLKIAMKESLIHSTMERKLEQIEIYESIQMVENLKKIY